MVFKNLVKKKFNSFKQNFLQEKSVLISFGSKTYFLKLKRRTQFFILFLLIVTVFNIFYIYRENIGNFHKNIVFQKNEELVKVNTDLENRFESIQKQVNLINKYLDVVDQEKNNFKDTKKVKSKKVLFKKEESLEKTISRIESNLLNIYYKINKRYTYTELKIKSLNLFSHQGKNIVYRKYKKKLNNLGVGGPFIPSQGFSVNVNKKEKTKSFSEMIDRAIENEKFLKLLPIGNPTRSDYRISSNFGYRNDPWVNKIAFHNGIDIVAEKDEISSTIDGVVTFAGEVNGYGKLVEVTKIIDENEVCIRFGHVKKIFVKTGDVVKKGQVIALQGNEGRSTAKHIHYEAKYNNIYLNPKNLLLVRKNI